MPAIIQTSITGVVIGWAIDRTMAGLVERVRDGGHNDLADMLDTGEHERGVTEFDYGFTLIVGEDAR